MKVYVINLARRPERMRYIAEQLANVEVAYERIDAVDGAALAKDDLQRLSNRFRWWCARGYMPRAGEIGCAMSHREAWRKAVDGNMAYECVLEDDVSLSSDFPNILREAETFLKDDEFARVIIFTPKISEVVPAECGGCFRRIRWAMSAGAYALNRKAAAQLLKVTMPLASPIDEWSRWAKRGGVQLYAAIPSVCSQSEYGSELWDSEFASDTRARDMVLVKDMSLPRRIAHKALRVVGKIIDGVLP